MVGVMFDGAEEALISFLDFLRKSFGGFWIRPEPF